MGDVFNPFGEEDKWWEIEDPEIIKEGREGRCGISGNGGGVYVNVTFENREEMAEFFQKVTTYDLHYNGPTYIKWKEEHNSA